MYGHSEDLVVGTELKLKFSRIKIKTIWVLRPRSISVMAFSKDKRPKDTLAFLWMFIESRILID